jgi:AcrR family transcriptional regulator
MNRTRDGLLDGALACIERDGLRRLTMSAICVRSGVAKATLYNHFRTKSEVLAALVGREVDRAFAAAEAAQVSGGLAAALAAAAEYVGTGRAVRRVAGHEPALLVGLLTPARTPPWDELRARLGVLADVPVEHPVVDLVLLWLGSQLVAPQPGLELDASAGLLAAAAAHEAGLALDPVAALGP